MFDRRLSSISIATLAAMLIILAAQPCWGQKAEGDCELYTASVNPGAGCLYTETECTGLWGAGTCQNHRASPWSLVLWCVCEPAGGIPKSAEEAAQKMSTADNLGTPPYTLVFTIDPTDPANLAELHPDASLGGGDIAITNHNGTVEVLVEAHEHPDSVYLTLLSLTSTMPSITLNNGWETGINHITMDPDNYSGGAASLIDGGFHWVQVLRITNDLFPPSNPIVGLSDGTGTFDFGTKTITYSSFGLDLHQLSTSTSVPGLTWRGLAAVVLALILAGSIVILWRRRQVPV